jgi:hypothetical protein
MANGQLPFLAVKNFDRFQHYRDRNPPWIKLYGDLLVDLEFIQLPEAAQAQLVKLWILASQLGNPLPNDPKLLAGKIAAPGKFHLATIIAAGFLIPCTNSASGALAAVLADGEQNDSPSVRGRNQRSELEVVDDRENSLEPPTGERELSALYLTIWSNAAVTERWGERPSPYTPANAVELEQRLRGIGVDWQVARLSIYRQCRESKQPHPPRGPGYFRQGIESDWNAELARRAVRLSGELPPAIADTTGLSAPPVSPIGPPRVLASNAKGDAALVFGKIRSLVCESQAPGQAKMRYIKKMDVAAMGPDVLAAYEAVGGSGAVLNTADDKLSFLITQFTNALEAARAAA